MAWGRGGSVLAAALEAQQSRIDPGFQAGWVGEDAIHRLGSSNILGPFRSYDINSLCGFVSAEAGPENRFSV